MRSSLALGLSVAVICLLSSGALAQDRRAASIDIPTVEYRGGIYYLVLDGETAYERGYQHGAALEFKIVAALRNFREWLRDQAAIEEPDRMIQEFARTTGHIETVKRRLPDLYEEMQGIADGAGVDFNELFVYQSFDELFLFLAQSGSLDAANGHCTTIGVYGRPDKPNYVTHNNDIPIYHEGAVTVLHIKYPDSDLEILQSTFAGQLAQNGVNNRGVGVGMNTIADLPTTSTGIPVSFNVRKILECNDRHEATEYLKGIEAGTAMNYMIADREQVISVETWENDWAIVDTYEGDFAVHTNHTLIDGAPVAFEMDARTGGGSYGFTHQRLALALGEFAKGTSHITLEDIKRLKSTRPILVNPGKPSGRTIMSLIVEIPREGSPVLYNTPDSPNWFEHVAFGF